MNSKTTLLIADDHPIFRSGLRETITADPSFEIVGEAGDGARALQLIETLRPDVAILDIHMPQRNGLDVARVAWERELPTKLIMLTMYDDEDLFNEAMNLGVAGYVLKESAVSDLLDAVRCVMGGRPFISPVIAGFLLNRRTEAELLRQQKPGLQQLTPTERRVLKLIAEDRTSKEIGEVLQISFRTVESHRQNICHKLDLTGSHSLLKFAYDHKSQL
jgi:DNA-binding NarL/FixJ family response regulator